MKPTHGFFVISLDFELFWGIRDRFTFQEMGTNVQAVWQAIPRLLELFKKYEIHATFATVGAMFATDLEELNEFLPNQKPNYDDPNLSPYNGYIEESINNNPAYFFGNDLLEMVKKYKNHEIGTHTFSHYYCLEDGQNIGSFIDDLNSAKSIANKKGVELKTLIFPRHQINRKYLKELPNLGINIYRETEKAWFHSAARGKDESIIKRAFRYADYFVWMGSHHCQKLEEIEVSTNFYGIRSSRWLRSFKYDFLNKLRMNRIKSQMKYASKTNTIFHLWFHPFEFGENTEKAFVDLEEILRLYKELNRIEGIKSMSMKELVEYKNQIDG